MLTRCLQLAALTLVVATGCTPPAENPHGVAESCDPSLAERLYAPGAVTSVEESHRVDLSHGSEEHIVVGATLHVRSAEDKGAFEKALRCHSVKARGEAATRTFDPLTPAGWAPEVSVLPDGDGLLAIEVTSKHRETATDILSRARALLQRSEAAPPAEQPAAAPSAPASAPAPAPSAPAPAPAEQPAATPAAPSGS
jgi:hypothetical protein